MQFILLTNLLATVWSMCLLQ